MADQDSGSKTEKPTPKKLRDARSEGNVAKSRDLTNTALLLLGGLLFWQLSANVGSELGQFTNLILTESALLSPGSLGVIGREATFLLLSISAKVVLPMAAFGILIDFVQTGPLFAIEKMAPKIENLNPIEGTKRMFSLDSLFELLKSIIKIVIVFSIAIYTLHSVLPEAFKLQTGGPMTLAVLLQSHTVMLFGWTMGVFVFIAILDFAYQSHSHEKKLMMSIRDLKDEYKNNEGDPHIKGQRQQLAREWAQEGAVNSASDASVLVVNPTHVAIALIYDKDQTPVPVVAARGVGDTALAMRRAAVASGVPVLRNIPLARQLLRDTENGDIVPRELFDIIAEVILWASANKETADHPPTGDAQSRPQPPGEDLSKETI